MRYPFGPGNTPGPLYSWRRASRHGRYVGDYTQALPIRREMTLSDPSSSPRLTRAQNAIHSPRHVFLHGRQKVPVDTQGDRDIRVAHGLRYRFDVDALGKEQGRRRVPEVVYPD